MQPLIAGADEVDIERALAEYREIGVGRLGRVIAPEFLELLRERADDLMLGRVVIPGLFFQHDSATGGGAQPSQHEAVGVAGGHRELPARQAEALCEHLGRGQGVLARQHGRQPARGLGLQRRRHRGRGVAEHRTGVAQAEVDVLVTVGVGTARRIADGRRRTASAHGCAAAAADPGRS